MSKRKKARGVGNPPPIIETPPDLVQKATFAQNPITEFKAAHKENPNDVLRKKIAWRFNRMDCSGLGKCTLKLLHKYHNKLVELENLTVDEIKSQSHNHDWSIKNLDPGARKRAQQLNIEDEILFQIKLEEKPRLYGIWEENIFHILWLDANHDKIYRCKNFNS